MRLTLDELTEARGDLLDMHSALGKVEQAAVMVADMPNTDAPVIIDLTVGQPVTITTGYVMPDHSLVKRPSAAPFEIVEVKQDTVEQEVSHDPSTDGAVTEQVAPKAGAERGAAPAAKKTKVTPPKAHKPAKIATGPMGEKERADIARRHSLGHSVPEIAAALGRRTQAVAQYVKILNSTRATTTAALSHMTTRGVTAEMPNPVVKSVEKSVSVAPVLPAVEPVVPPTSIKNGIPDDLRGEQRRIWQALDKVGYAAPFDAEIDLEVAEALFGGSKMNELSLDLGIDQQIMTARFRAVSACIRDDRGNLSINGQADLLGVLRARVKQARA